MGKKLVIYGADFSANGISVPDYELVDVAEWINASNFLNNILNLIKEPYTSTGFLSSSYAEINVQNWPSSVPLRNFNLLVKEEGTYHVLTWGAANTILTINTAYLPSEEHVLSNQIMLFVQSGDGNTFSAEEQQAIVDAHVVVTVNFYHLGT